MKSRGVWQGPRQSFRVCGLGFRVWYLGFRVLGFRVWGLGFRVWGFGLRFSGLGSGVSPSQGTLGDVVTYMGVKAEVIRVPPRFITDCAGTVFEDPKPLNPDPKPLNSELFARFRAQSLR